jgi:hypothetical protein
MKMDEENISFAGSSLFLGFVYHLVLLIRDQSTICVTLSFSHCFPSSMDG